MAEQNFDHRCPGCFEENEETPVCPHCGYDEAQQRSPLVLPHRTLLSNRYLAGRVLGKPGGFGITYLGLNTALEELVAVKEYLPRELAGRETDQETVRAHSEEEAEQFQYGLDRFMNEAQMLAQFEHANIVGVRDFFEANGTAYLVMDYYEGKTLKQYLQGQPEGRMDPEIGTEIMLRVLDGLKEVHAEGYLHRDVKPENVYLTAEGRPILIDFGAARLALGEKSRSLSVVMTEGYAPYEQYRREGDQGPWTDVYGAGATLYRMVTGEKPPAATDRVVDDTLQPPHEVNPEVPKDLSRAITGALATGNKERPESAEALQDRLRAGLHGGSAEQETVEPRQQEEPSRGPADVSEASTEPSTPGGENDHEAETSMEEDGAPWPSVLIGVLVVAALGLGGVAVALYPSGEGAAVQDTEQTADAGSPKGSEQSSSSDPSASSGDRSKTEQLLKEARGHLGAGRLTSPEGTNALASVRQALEQSPGSEEAQRLLGQIADRFAERGTAARQEGNLQAAVDFFERSLEIESRPGVRDKLETVRSRMQKQEKYERLLGDVRSTLNQESPSASELGAAAGVARDAKEMQSESEEVEKFLDQIAARATELGQQAEASFRYQQAIRYYEQGVELREDAAVRKQLESAREIRNGRTPIRTFRGHKDTVLAVAFSPDGSQVATVSYDGTARLWSAQTGEEVQVLRGHGGRVTSVAFSPDGSPVVTGSFDDTARLWSAETGEEIQVLRGSDNGVASVAFSPDGSLVATGSRDGTARLWSARTGEEIGVLRGHEEMVWRVAFSPDGSLVATVSRDGTARLWSARTGEEIQVLRGHEETVWRVAFSPDGSLVATGSGDGTARLWSAQTGDEVQVLRDVGLVRSVIFSPDGSQVATGSMDGTARLWSAQTGEEIQVFRGHERAVAEVAFSPDGSLMATGSADGTAKLWYVPQEL